jgi:hypothetical protein
MLVVKTENNMIMKKTDINKVIVKHKTSFLPFDLSVFLLVRYNICEIMCIIYITYQ